MIMLLDGRLDPAGYSILPLYIVSFHIDFVKVVYNNLNKVSVMYHQFCFKNRVFDIQFDIWVIPCQIIQNFNSAQHHRLGFAWNFAQLFCPMNKNCCQNFPFFGQVVIEMRVVKVWPNSRDPVPSAAHISGPMAHRKILLIPLERYLKESSGYPTKWTVTINYWRYKH